MGAFRIITLIVGLIPLWFGLNGVIFGAAEQMGGEPFTTAMDNQYRYLSGVYVGLAVMIFYSALGSPVEMRAKAHLFRFAMIAFFIGGCARVVSTLVLGTPPSWQLAGMFAELGAPLLLVWQARVMRS